MTVQFVSGNYFGTLGVRAILGRAIAPEDDQLGSESAGVAVLSHRFWQRRFGGDPDVVNQTIDLNRKPFAIIGQLTGLQVALPHCMITPKPPPPTLDESLVWAANDGAYGSCCNPILPAGNY